MSSDGNNIHSNGRKKINEIFVDVYTVIVLGHRKEGRRALRETNGNFLFLRLFVAYLTQLECETSIITSSTSSYVNA